MTVGDTAEFVGKCLVAAVARGYRGSPHNTQEFWFQWHAVIAEYMTVGLSPDLAASEIVLHETARRTKSVANQFDVKHLTSTGVIRRRKVEA